MRTASHGGRQPGDSSEDVSRQIQIKDRQGTARAGDMGRLRNENGALLGVTETL